MLYPQQNDKRNILDLSGIWDFQIDPQEIGEAEGLVTAWPTLAPWLYPPVGTTSTTTSGTIWAWPGM